MNVLVALANADGQVVSRQSMLDQVWPNQVVSDDALTTVISTLRRQLGDDRRQPRYIETVPKRGYRLVESPRALEPPREAARSATTGRSNRQPLPLALALTLALALIAGIVYWSIGKRAMTPPLDKSIAVLPFDVFSEDPQLPFFADGLAEELIHQLSSDPQLKVTSRTSSFRFRDSEHTAKEIGQKLAVGNILEGSVRSQEDSLRVTVQLIDTSNDVHRWSHVFDAKTTDLLAIQEQVSEKVAALVTGDIDSAMVSTRLRHPVSNQAYELYLLGQSHMRVATVEAYVKSAQYLAEAIRLAPDYPIALTQYAAVRLLLHQYRDDDLTEATVAASEALDKALSIDPTLAQARAVYGLLHTYNEHYPAATLAFESALALNPNLSFALHNYAFMFWRQGRWENVLVPIRRALALDPISGAAHFLLADSLAALGRFDRSQEAYARCHQLIPNNHSCLLGHASVARMLGDTDVASDLTERAAQLVAEDYVYLLTMRLSLATVRQDDAAAERFDQRVSAILPKDNFVWRTRLVRAQKHGQVAGFLTQLASLRETAPDAADQLEAHAQYWLGNCSAVMAIYRRQLARSRDLLNSHWVHEFGHSHLTNLLHCQRVSGQMIVADEPATLRAELPAAAPEPSYPAALYLSAKLLRLEGQTAASDAVLARLAALKWPFFWLAEQDPIFADG